MSSPSHPRALIGTEWEIRASSCLGGAGVWGLAHSESFITGSQKLRPGGATSPLLPVLWGFSLPSCIPCRRYFLGGLGEAGPGPGNEEGASEKRTEHSTCSLATPCSRRDWMIPRTRSGCRIRTVAFSSSGTCRQRSRSLPPRSPPSSGGTETLQPPLPLRPGGTPGPQPRSPSRPLRSARSGPRSRGAERPRGRDRNAAAASGARPVLRELSVVAGPGESSCAPPGVRSSSDRGSRFPRDEPRKRKIY